MRFQKAHRTGSGFWAIAEKADRLPMAEAGEMWAAPDWSIRSHRHPSHEVYLQTKGRSRWEIDGQQVDVPENGAYLISGGIEHRLLEFTEPTTHFIFLVFDESNLTADMREVDCWETPYRIFPAAHPLKLPLEGLIHELAIPDPWQRESVSAYIRALCAGLTGLSEKPVTRTTLDRHPCAERAMELLASRVDHPWRLDELARLSGVSRQHLIELFRAEFGRTPMRCLHQMRLEEARRQLIETDKSVTAISMDVGFASSQYLSSSYRRHFGLSPGAERKHRKHGDKQRNQSV